jgi:hypothetical protein
MIDHRSSGTVLERRAGQRQAEVAAQARATFDWRVVGFLMFCASSRTTPSKVTPA